MRILARRARTERPKQLPAFIYPGTPAPLGHKSLIRNITNPERLECKKLGTSATFLRTLQSARAQNILTLSTESELRFFKFFVPFKTNTDHSNSYLFELASEFVTAYKNPFTES